MGSVKKRWLVLFWGSVLGLCLFSMTALHKKKEEARLLSLRLEEMESQRVLLEEKREELLLALQSQTDPAWIELVLMRELGVVPENWLKVHFVPAK